MPHACDNCGNDVSADYHRVFSLNDGSLLACPACGRHVMVDRTLRKAGQYRDAGGQESFLEARREEESP